MPDDIDHLDWDVEDENGYVRFPIGDGGGWGTVTFMALSPQPQARRRNWNAILGWTVMLCFSVPFWLLAGYGAYCLVRR